MPEDLQCDVVAAHRVAYDALWQDPEFVEDWRMDLLVEAARDRVGPLSDGHKYCFKIASVLGGRDEEDNLASMGLVDLIASSGYVARQIDGIPDGTRIKIRIRLTRERHRGSPCCS